LEQNNIVYIILNIFKPNLVLFGHREYAQGVRGDLFRNCVIRLAADLQ
jgi:hypothetical protein